MKNGTWFKALVATLTGRAARNVLFWIVLFVLVHDMNLSNERSGRYGIVNTGWYWLVIGAGMLFQMLLVYVNNLLLVPRLLAQRRYARYLLGAFMLALAVSLCYTLGLKLANAHIEVSHLQQPGMATGPISGDWSALAFRVETQMYLFGNLLWLLIFTMAWYMNDYSRQRQVTERALRQQAETELAFLRNQMSPHFLLNTLNNIYGLALKQSAETPEQLLKLSVILKYLLYESNRQLASFEKEKEIMLAYIELELLRIKDRSRITFSITADRDCLIPPLLWLPQLENMFKHGTRIISGELFADFRFSITGDRIDIRTSNYFKPGAVRTESGSGIGLKNLEKRLQLLYPARHRIEAGAEERIFNTGVSITMA